MLVHTGALDDHHVARFPVDAAAVMDVVAAAFEHVEHGAVEVPVLLAVGAGCVAFDVGLDRLHNVGGLRAHDVLAVERRPPFPGVVARRIDPRLLEQGLVDVAIRTGEFAHEGALFRPALPLPLLVLDRRTIVALSGGLLIKAGHPVSFPCRSDGSLVDQMKPSVARSAGKKSPSNDCGHATANSLWNKPQHSNAVITA